MCQRASFTFLSTRIPVKYVTTILKRPLSLVFPVWVKEGRREGRKENVMDQCIIRARIGSYDGYPETACRGIAAFVSCRR